MADERSTHATHKRDKNMVKYDWKYYEQLLPYISGEVLDLGCGAGMFIEQYSKKDDVVSVLGLDKFIEEAPVLPKVTYEKFILPDELGVSKDSAQFDTIVSTEFLEHIEREKLESLLEKVKGLLKLDGIFVGSTPNKKKETTNPYHLYEYTLNELASIFHNYFSDVEIWDNGQNCVNWKCKL